MRWHAGANKDGSNYDALRLLTPHLQVYGTVAPAVEQWASQHPELPLAPMPWAPEAARAGFRPGACYLVRPDGYVAYASPQFDGAELQTYLRDIWGWGGAGTIRAGR